MADFSHLLARNTSSIEKPKALPGGTYYAIISDKKVEESAKKKTPMVVFALRVTEAGDGVDQTLLEGIDLGKKPLRKTFFLTEDALFRLVVAAESLKIPTTDRSLGDIIEDMLHQEVMIEVKEVPNADGTEFYNEVGNMVARAA